ncbi:Clf1 protein [Saccharomycopsis crataegensis]|uniref:Pre-mRNA-splicing factor CLF1 n=1 Tax=Saccharomycopsis crataegensis TaxID=43959 RepID=A0AAV5QK53_9ASCO|nr:Clf1 protein [Saccharomycopsis crataegensis]
MSEGSQKNKNPASLQLTAESLLQEAYESQAVMPLNEDDLAHKIADLEESKEFQGRKRSEFEKHLRKDYHNVKSWLNYANFEFSQHEMARVRSIFERALGYNKDNVQLWIRYADLELKNKSINHARNLLERAIRILPFVDKVWFYYAQLEESLGNIQGARNIFERWLLYEPRSNVYDTYINMERRNGNNMENLRKIFEKYVIVYPNSVTWIKWGNCEDKNGSSDITREVFTTAVDTLFQIDKEDQVEDVLIRWIEFEASRSEFERSRLLFKFGLNKLPKEFSKKLFDKYLIFEKKYGDYDNDGTNLLLLNKRKAVYDEDLEKNPTDYDLWWVYITLMQELSADKNGLIEVYEMAVNNKPLINTKKTVEWKKYIYLWIRYLYFVELDMKDIEKTRELYKRLLEIIPHESFTFSKVWINYAEFEIRQHKLTDARRILGRSLGIHGKPKTFKYYISLEKSLKEMDRVRKLYENYLIKFPHLINVWLEYATLETNLGDHDRATGIYEIATAEPAINNSLIVWYKYVNFLSEEVYDYDKARGVLERVLEMNKQNVKVWIKIALFEATAPNEAQLRQILENEEDEEIEISATPESVENARRVFEDGLKYFKSQESVDKRVLLIEAYKQFEDVYGDEASIENVSRRLPTLVKKTKEDSEEEIIEYKFPDDIEKDNAMLKFLQNAQKWKKRK